MFAARRVQVNPDHEPFAASQALCALESCAALGARGAQASIGIAAALTSQEATVKVHRSRLMRKLCVRSVPELVHLAECGGLDVTVARDRGATAASPIEACAPRAPRASHESKAQSAWLAANGSWSGFTWTRRAANTRPPDA